MEIVTNPVILFLIAIASLIIGLIPFLLGLKKRRFMYRINSFELVRGDNATVSGLSVRFCNNEINQLVISRVAIWYGGRGSVNANELAKTKPLSIEIDNESEILDAEIIDVNDEDSMVSIIEKRPNCVKFGFDFFDHNSGFVVEIIHTGKAADLGLIGKIQGGDKPKRVREPKDTSKENRKKLRKLYIALMLVIVLLFFFMTITYGILLCTGFASVLFPKSLGFMEIPLLIFMIVYCVLTGWMTYDIASREYKLDVPSGLRKDLNLE